MLNKDDVIRLANKAELCQSIWVDTEDEVIKSLVRFAKLVAEHSANVEREKLREAFRVVTAAEVNAAIANEREACAKVCDDIRHPWGYSSETSDWERGTEHCADAIRARGEA